MSTNVRGAWRGWSGHTVVELTDGSIWQQAEYHYEYRYAYRPAAVIASGRMTVAGMSRAVRVKRVAGGARRQMAGAWQGWAGDTLVELTDGTIWKQVEYFYEYQYAYRPEVVLVDDQMYVEGVSRSVRVQRVK